MAAKIAHLIYKVTYVSTSDLQSFLNFKIMFKLGDEITKVISFWEAMALHLQIEKVI